MNFLHLDSDINKEINLNIQIKNQKVGSINTLEMKQMIKEELED